MTRNSCTVSYSLPSLPVLPFDVLHCVLAWLSQNDLRKAAASSRTFRAAAKQAGLYIHRTIKWDPARSVYQDISILLAVIEHAREDNGRISIELSYVGMVPWTPVEKDTLYSITRGTFEYLASCVSLAMRYVVFLRVSLPDNLMTAMDVVLLHPAPHLHTFELRDCGYQGALRQTPRIHLPTDLFAGDAPKLRSISIEYVPLGSNLIAAFSRVEHFRVQYEDDFPDTDVVRHFPRLSSLEIAYRYECGDPPTPTCVLRGLGLHRFGVEVHDPSDHLLPMISNQLDLSSIPVIECASYASAHETIWDAPLCANEGADLVARISQHDDHADTVAIDVTTRDRDRRCTYIIGKWDLLRPYAFFGGDMLFLSLQLDNTYLPGLLESGIALPRLRDLRIDLRTQGDYAAMVWPLAWGVALSPDEGGDAQGAYSVPCPELETLEIVALEKHMRVRDIEVVQLSEALGQLDREDGARAQLILRGVSLFSVGLEQMFSTVRSVPFCAA